MPNTANPIIKQQAQSFVYALAAALLATITSLLVWYDVIGMPGVLTALWFPVVNHLIDIWFLSRRKRWFGF